MSETVKSTPTPILDAACKAAQPASSLQISIAAQQALHHLGGYILGGLRVFQIWDGLTATGGGGTWRYYGHRHPNCDHQIWCVRVAVTGKDTASVACKSGTGTTITQTLGSGLSAATWDEWVIIRAPWAGGDSGYQPLTLTLTDCSLRSLTVIDMPRSSLDAGEHMVESYDTTYPRIGIREEEVIGDSSTAGVKGLLEQISNIWDDFKRTLVTWATPEPVDYSSDAWGTVLLSGADDILFWCQSRQKRSELVNDARAYVYVTVPAGTEYMIRVTSSNPGGSSDTVTSGTLDSTDDGWQILTGLEVDATERTSILLEADRTSGSGDISFYALVLMEG